MLCYCVFLLNVCFHNSTPSDTSDQVVIHSFFKHMEPPSMAEGFASVTYQQFVPHMPDDVEASRLLASYVK